MKHVIVVGAGGLGGPIALSLAGLRQGPDAATTGLRFTVFDDDVVELSNLQRQLHFAGRVGAPKADVLAECIEARGCAAVAARRRWTEGEPPKAVDLIIDASDSPETKFAVSRWAVRHRLPYLIAAAVRYEGGVFVGLPGHACYACLFERPPALAATCALDGVLGATVGIIGGLAAELADQMLLGHAEASYVAVASVFDPPRTLRLRPRPDCVCVPWQPGPRVRVTTADGVRLLATPGATTVGAAVDAAMQLDDAASRQPARFAVRQGQQLRSASRETTVVATDEVWVVAPFGDTAC